MPRTLHDFCPWCLDSLSSLLRLCELSMSWDLVASTKRSGIVVWEDRCVARHLCLCHWSPRRATLRFDALETKQRSTRCLSRRSSRRSTVHVGIFSTKTLRGQRVAQHRCPTRHASRTVELPALPPRDREHRSFFFFTIDVKLACGNGSVARRGEGLCASGHDTISACSASLPDCKAGLVCIY